MKTQKPATYQPQGHTEVGSTTVPFWMGWLRGGDNGKQIKPPPPRKLTPEPKKNDTSR